MFLTHLHSDHTLGLPDLIFTPWVLGRKEPLDLYGPTGTTAMAGRLEAAWEQDIDVRVHGLERANTTGYQVTAHDVEAGVVYREGDRVCGASRVLGKGLRIPDRHTGPLRCDLRRLYPEPGGGGCLQRLRCVATRSVLAGRREKAGAGLD